MTNLGSITGMELPTGPYTFRHGNAQALDNSSEKTVIVGRVLCSPVYRGDHRRAAEHHLTTSQFLRSPEELCLEIYARHSGCAIGGLRPQTALMRAASGMSRTIDPRRPRKLNLAQQTEVGRHLEVRLLRRRLKSLLQTFRDQKRSMVSMKRTLLYSHYRQIYQALRNLRRRYEKALLTEVKEKPVINIQRQSKGLSVAEQEALRAAEYVFAERDQAIDTLFTFTRSSTEEEY
ncbi:MAG: hypothetical protein Q9194_007527 [Teloschistes cf. exilis]